MRAAASSTKVSSGKTERIAAAASAAVGLSIRSSLPSRVWRAIEVGREVGVGDDQIVAVAHGAQRIEHVGVEQRIDTLEHDSSRSSLLRRILPL